MSESATFQIASVDGVMPTSVNGFNGYRFFLSLNEPAHAVGEGVHLHVFAQKENRWKAGDEVEIEATNEGFNLNGPGEEDLPEGEGTYVYAKIKKPEGAQQRSSGRFQRQSQGYRKPQAQTQGYQKPQATQAAKPAPTAAAPAAAPVKKISLEEADVAYDRLLGESLRACQHTLKDFAGQVQITNEVAFALIGEMANTRARAIFDGYVAGKVDITPRRNPIQELTKGVDADIRGDEDGMD